MAEYAETLEVTGCASLFRMKFADNSVAPFFFLPFICEGLCRFGTGNC